MGSKKKYHGKYGLFFGVLFFLFVGLLSTSCFASVSEDFVDYVITTLDENGSWGSQNTAYHNALSHITDEQKTSITQYINSKLTELGIGPYTERNCIVLTAYFNGSTMEVLWTFSNVSAGDDSLGYLQLWRNGSNDTFGAYDGTIYYLNLHISYNSSGNSTNLSWYGSGTPTSSNVKTFWPGSPTFTTLDNAYVLTMSNIANGSSSNQVWCTQPWQSGANMTYAFIHDKSENGGYIAPTPPDPEPPQDSTGTITNSSGETTGAIDLSGLQNGITDVKNQISGDSQRIIDNQTQNTTQIVNALSGETEKITNTLTEDANDLIDNTVINSGDISNTVDFSTINNNQNYSAYTNFWYTLTTGFSNSMTNIVRTLPVEFRGDNYIINLDEFTVFIPSVLKTFLSIVSSVFVCLYITRESKHIVEDIQTASIDNVANKLTEDFETNMF